MDQRSHRGGGTDADEFRNVEPPRPLNDWETGILTLMLEGDDPWNEAARTQVATGRVSAQCPNCPAVDLVVSDNAPRIRELDGTPAWGPLRIAQGTDRDGMFVEALAIIQAGRLAYIDVWRGDGEKHIDPPLDTFRLLERRLSVPAFFDGERVRVRPDYHFAPGATGTVRATFAWEGGGGRSLVHVVDGVDGPILFYWVELG